LLGKKKDRNQWTRTEKNAQNWDTYNKLMEYSWYETEVNFPAYFRGLKFCVEHCRGEVLEIGCGIGTMTKWIAQQELVTRVIAIDNSPEAIEKLRESKFLNVYPILMDLQSLNFEGCKKFDTVMLCEVLEHIYLDEEKKMLISLKPYIDKNTFYIISTPIYWMDDPYHVRGFSKSEFKKHLRRYYGEPQIIDYSVGYRQIAIGRFSI
jgi:2-polyprenyl-3-methyl-5-hydroxy-6-metoxy-1,4-benzoquinol methylase